MRYPILSIIGISIFFGCSNAAKEDSKNDLGYFDLKSYFQQEATRLARKNPVFNKTVLINADAETKTLRISDWPTELAVFSDANINRASWKGLFKVQKSPEKDIYRSENEKVPVKEVIVEKRGNRIYGIQIKIDNVNSLYTSSDTLTYYPDSLYHINKTQHIKLLPSKHYQIIGKFKP